MPGPTLNHTTTAKCAACGFRCRWEGHELYDLESGLPHRLTCPRMTRDRRRVTSRHHHCDVCGSQQSHQEVRDRRGRISVCLQCGHGTYKATKPQAP